MTRHSMLLLIASVVTAVAADEPEHHRIVSSQIAEALAAARPVFTPPSERKSIEAAKPDESNQRANDIVRLPQMTVREPKLPDETEVLTPRALAEREMKRYLGPRDGFDRGLLNAVTIADLWKKIPVLGTLIGCPIPSMTNEQRAMMYYQEDERLRKMNDLGDLIRLTKISGDAASASKIQDETTRAFDRARPQ